MEEALILVVLSPSFNYDDVKEIRKLPGVEEAQLIYGAYDMFVTIKAKNTGELRQTVINIRGYNGVRSTLTCNVMGD
jgi:hypothetical protein